MERPTTKGPEEMFETCNTIANIEIANIANIDTACETIRNARKGRRCLVLRNLRACKVTCNTCASVYDVCDSAAYYAACKAEYREGTRYYRTGEGYANFYCSNYAGMKTYTVRTDCAAYTQCDTGSLPPRAPRAGKARFATAAELAQHDAWFRNACERVAKSECTISARYIRNARRRELYRLHKTAQKSWARSCTEWREMVYTLATAKPGHRSSALYEMLPRLRECCKVGRDAEGAHACYETRLALLRGIARNELTIPQAQRVKTLCERFAQCRA